MSIANEIERLSAAKTAIAESIAAKGIVVPSDTKLDGMAPLIDSIETGSGSIWDEEIPNDGKTRIFIHLEDGRTSPVLGCGVNGTVTVDWGDGTDPDTLTGTAVNQLKYTNPHAYEEPGDYVITLTVTGTVAFTGDGLHGTYLLAASETRTEKDCVYISSIRKVVIGDGVTVYTSGLAQAGGLSSVTFSSTGATLNRYAVSFCYALANVTFLGDVKTFSDYVFDSDYGVAYYDFGACTKVPTLTSTTTFISISDDCEIRVPAALYDEWIAATNWASLADHIVAV